MNHLNPSSKLKALLPCPFCDTPAIEGINGEGFHWARCPNGDCFNRSQFPVNYWQTRTPLPELKKVREALRCANNSYVGSPEGQAQIDDALTILNRLIEGEK